MYKVYNIGDINILLDIPYELHMQDESLDFMRDLREDDNISDMTQFKFTLVESLSEPADAYSIELRKYKEYNGCMRTWFLPKPDADPYAMVQMDFSPFKFECFYLEDSIEYMNYSHNLINLMGLESIFTFNHGILLHSSFIRYNDYSIVFTAPSGTGKSTQASLWAKYQGAEILNGDRTGIRKKDGVWMCYGLPYAGSSCIYHNTKTPLKAIFVLRQKDENQIRRLAPAEAFVHLYTESHQHSWDKHYTSVLVDNINELVTEIPVFMLSCLPDEGAVNMAKQAIEDLDESR